MGGTRIRKKRCGIVPNVLDKGAPDQADGRRWKSCLIEVQGIEGGGSANPIHASTNLPEGKAWLDEEQAVM